MNYNWPGSSFQPRNQEQQYSPQPSQSLELFQMETFSPMDHTWQHPYLSHDLGGHLHSQILQAHGDDHMPLQGDFTTGQTSMQFSPMPTTPMTQPYNLPVLDETNNTHEQPMAPPPLQGRKRKAPTLGRDEWDPVKDRVIELHITQGLPLPKVKEMVEEEFESSGFQATIRQYRSRLTQWGLDKNIKPKEMEAIVRKRQRRKLVEDEKGDLIFKVRGNIVEPEKIERWMKRKGVAETTLYAPSPVATTPGALSAWTGSERASPAPSSAISAGSPASVTSHLMSPGPNLGAQSPAPSFSGIFMSTSSNFAGKSPAPIYRTLFDSEAETLQSDSSQRYGAENNPQPATDHQPSVVTEHRYRGLEEKRLRLELSLSETRLGKEHPETLHVLQSLGGILVQQGRYKSAGEAFTRTSTGFKELYGKDHIYTLNALDAFGHVLLCQGVYDRARELFQRVLKGRRMVLGAEHPDTLHSSISLSVTYLHEGLAKEAEHLLAKTLDLLMKVLGAEDYFTLTCMTNLARSYALQKRWKEAEDLQAKCLETSKRVLGAEHPHTLVVMNGLASTYLSQLRYKESEAMMAEVLKICKRVLGEEHPYTLESMQGLSAIWKARGRYDEALELLRKCVEVRNRVLGVDHPIALVSSERLAQWEAG